MRQWFATDSKSGRRAVSTLSKNVNSIESKNNCVSRKSVSLWTPPVAPSFPSASFASLSVFFHRALRTALSKHLNHTSPLPISIIS